MSEDQVVVEWPQRRPGDALPMTAAQRAELRLLLGPRRPVPRRARSSR